MSQTFNNTFTINGGCSETTGESQSITLEPKQLTQDGKHTLCELKTTMPLTNQANGPQYLTLHNSHAYNIALLDCQGDGDGITGIKSFAFSGVNAVEYDGLRLPSYDGYYGTHFLEYLLELQEKYESTGDGFRLSSLFDEISLDGEGGYSAYHFHKDDANNKVRYRRLGLATGNIEGTDYSRVRTAARYEGVSVPETLFFGDYLPPESYDYATGDSKNIYRPGSVSLAEGLHFIIPSSNSFTLFVIPQYYSQMTYGELKDHGGNVTGWGETFVINVLAFHFEYKILEGRVVTLENITYTRHSYTHPVPFQISGSSIIYHKKHSDTKIFPLGGSYDAFFKLRHKVYVTTARGISDHSLTVLDKITNLHQDKFYFGEPLKQNGKQIYIKTPKKVAPFRNEGQVTTQYTLNDQDNRELTISPSIKQIEKLVLRPEDYLDSGTETRFSLDNNADINITSPKLFIKKIILNGSLTISEDD